MIRINIFANGDHTRQQGKVIIVDGQTSTWQAFLSQAAQALHLQPMQNRAFTKEGGEVTGFQDLIQDDVLFISEATSAFQAAPSMLSLEHSTLLQASQIVENSSNSIVAPANEEETSSSPYSVILQVQPVLSDKSTKFKPLTLKLKHRKGKISKIKARIRKFRFIHEKDQMLLAKGEMWDDDKQLCDYLTNEEQKEFTVFVVVKPLTLFVRTKMGSMFLLDENARLHHYLTVKQLKEIAARRAKMEDTDANFLFEGKVLQEGVFLGDVGLYSGCTLWIQ